MNVTIEDAYREACAALGEAIVTQRLLTAELQRLTPEPTSSPSSNSTAE